MNGVRTVVGAVAAGGVLALFGLRAQESRRVAQAWQSLAAEPATERFLPERVADLPGPAQRYLRHAIRDGTPLATSVRLAMSGAIQTEAGGPWMSLKAEELLAPPRGFVWKATARSGLLRLVGADTYVQGEGQLSFWLFGLFPVVRAAGEGVSRSSIGRLVGEAVWCPATLLPREGVSWEPIDDDRVRVTMTVEGHPTPMTLDVAPDGRLREVVVLRYNESQKGFAQGEIPFGVVAEEEATFEGYTIPVRVRGGWGYGTGDYVESFRFTIEAAHFG